MRSLLLICIAFSFFIASNGQLIKRNHVGSLNMRLKNHKLLQAHPTAAKAQYCTQPLDHSDPLNTVTFQQKYYVNDTYWKGPSGPVFFVLGGEGPVSAAYVSGHFAVNQWAQQYGGLIVALEHRFYGETIPLNDSSTSNLRFLSSQQALQDAARFHGILTKQYNIQNSKWIVVGGSYSGNLSAWLRMKYPHLFHASISASGPLRAQLDYPEYFEVVATSIGEQCSNIVKQSTKAVETLLKTTNGRKQLQVLFNTCSDIVTDDDVSTFVGSLSNPIAGIVQYNIDNNSYQPFNITSMCDLLATSSPDPLTALAVLVNTYNNMSAPGQCMEVSYEEYITESQSTSDGRSWTWQTCTEFGYFQTGESANQPFSSLISLDSFLKICDDMFGIHKFVPNIQWTNEYYGSTEIVTSNTFFTNGDVDPWHVLGLNEGDSFTGENSVIVSIPGTAHCSILYPPFESPKQDLPSLQRARQLLQKYIDIWLA